MSGRILGVLGGKDMPAALLAEWARSATRVFAADSGADRLLGEGIRPHVVIGDMDSISHPLPEAADQVIHLPDQDSTDCDKLLHYAESQSYSSITLAAVEGDRLDHVLSTLASAVGSNLKIRIALRRGIGWIIKPDRPVQVETTMGQRLSFLPLSECNGVHLSGVEWPLSRAKLSLGNLVSISNRSTSGFVRIEVEQGAGMFVLENSPIQQPDWTEGFANR